MNYSTDFKPMVAAYMNRDASLFVAGTVDLILAAANQAKALAQRRHPFNHAKDIAQVAINSANGAALSTAKDQGGTNSIAIRRIEAAALNVTAGLVPIDIITRSAQHERSKRLMSGYSLTHLASNNLLVDDRPNLVQLGTSVMLWPWPGNMTVVLDIIKWMPEYVVSTCESDFFLVECHDWLLYQTVSQLNFYLKEDERVVISKELMKEAWEAVVSWDAHFEGSPPVLD